MLGEFTKKIGDGLVELGSGLWVHAVDVQFDEASDSAFATPWMGLEIESRELLAGAVEGGRER